MRHSIKAGLVVILLGMIGCGGGGVGTTRGATGTISAASLSGLTLKNSTQGLTLKNQTLACTDVKICCGGYDGTLLVATVASDCTFSLDLPLNNFCYCALFSGTDADENNCPDNYLGSLGCSDNGYGGAIPIFADDDDTTDDISFGTATVQGQTVVATGDPCAQVDQDNDGTDDASDTDDDGDSTADEDDRLNTIGCENADEFDSDDDGVPDIYENVWSDAVAALKVGGKVKAQIADSFTDTDSDNVPDFCDEDFACTADSDDTDGNCIPDIYDECNDDDDDDGLPYCVDCDDADPASTVECYSTDFCSIDFDGDGLGLCDDCDDNDDSVLYECFGDNFCLDDEDKDNFGYCLDCDDADATVTTECYTDLGFDICSLDDDGDSVGLCTDCDDSDASNTITIDQDCCLFDGDSDDIGICIDCDDDDATSTTECYGASVCDDDADSDGTDFCDDCDDLDATLNNSDADGDNLTTCEGDCDDNDSAQSFGCTSGGNNCSSMGTVACDNSFECQLHAEEALAAGSPVCSGNSVSCLTCSSGCCLSSQ